MLHRAVFRSTRKRINSGLGQAIAGGAQGFSWHRVHMDISLSSVAADRRALERGDDVHHLLAPTGPLQVGQLALAAVGDAGFGHAVVAARCCRRRCPADGSRPVTRSSRSSALTMNSCEAATTRLPLGSTWVTIPASRRVTASLRRTCPAPVLVLPLLAEIKVDGVTAFGRIASCSQRNLDPGRLAAGAGCRRHVLQVGIVIHSDQNRNNVAHLGGALVLEERS